MGAEYSTEDGGSGGSGPEGESSPAVLVVCGPSGVGKGTLIDMLMSDSGNFGFSVSHTTRPARDGEQNGTHYYFTSKEDFEAGISCGKFLEYARVHHNLYGTSVDAVNAVLNKGKCCILEIDVQGAKQVRASGIRAIFLFITPPSEEELENRLRSRGTDSEEQIQIRLRTAKDEVASSQEPGLFDYCIVNNVLADSYRQLREIATNAKNGQVPERVEKPRTVAQNGALLVKGPAAVGGPSHSPSVSAPVPGMEKWKRKVALVTAASTGIGWAVSIELCASGVRVIALAREREQLERLQQVIMARGVPASEFLPVVCDTTKEAEVVALPKIVSKRWSGAGIDILINIAGHSRSNATLFDGSTAAWVDMMGTNVLGVCMCAREVLQNMKSRGEWGHIINVSCLGNSKTTSGNAVNGFFDATKQTVQALTEGLRKEALANNVPVHVSCISSSVPEAEAAATQSGGPTGGNGSEGGCVPARKLGPDDVARSIVWMLSVPQHMEVNDVLITPADPSC